MRIRTLLAAPVGAVAAMGLAVAPAMAQGQVEQGPDHANSICSYSGLNDHPDAEFPEGGRVQSYGQLVRQKVIPPREVRRFGPGTDCNGHIHPYPENPPPPPG